MATQYSTTDILDILGVSYPYTKDEAVSCLQQYCDKHNGTTDYDIINFFNQAKQKISEYFQTNEGYSNIANTSENQHIHFNVSEHNTYNNDDNDDNNDSENFKDYDNNGDDDDEYNDDEYNDELDDKLTPLPNEKPIFERIHDFVEPNEKSKKADEQFQLKPTKLILNIDSIFRENYHDTTSNNFTIKLPYNLTNVMSIRLSSIEIPNTWYMFSDTLGNTSFDIEMKGGTYGGQNLDTETFNIRIPEGNWNFRDLSEDLNTYFSNHTDIRMRLLQTTVSSTNGKFTFYIRSFESYQTVTTNEDANDIFVFYYSSVFGDDPTTGNNWDLIDEEGAYGENHIIGDDNTNRFSYTLKFHSGSTTEGDENAYLSSQMSRTAGWMLGFRQSSYTIIASPETKYTTLTDTYNGSITGEAVSGVSKYNYIYFSVDDHISGNSKDTIISKKNDTYESQDILGRINIKYGSFFVNVDEGDNVFKQRDYTGPVTLERLTIKIIDRYGNVLDINNSDYSLLFEVVQLQ